jgi:hypothetical protein
MVFISLAIKKRPGCRNIGTGLVYKFELLSERAQMKKPFELLYLD